MLDEEVYRKLFVEESRENHEVIVRNLLILENGEDETAIDEIFRSAHTLKGMSASMGYMEMESLCHSMEDAFQLIRSGQMKVTQRLIDLLLAGTDVIEEMLDEVESKKPITSGRSDLLVKELKQYSAGEPEPAVTQIDPAAAPAPDTPPAETASPTFTIIIRVDASCNMKDVRAMLALQNLEQFGSILSTRPSREMIEDGRFEGAFEVLIASDAGEEALRTAASGTDIVEVKVVSGSAADPEPAEESENGVSSPDEHAAGTVKRSEKNREIKNIRVDIEKMDRMMNLVEDLVINRGRLEQIAKKHGIKEFDEALSMVGRSVSDLQNLMMGIRMMPLDRIFNRLPRVVRDVANHDGKEVEFIIEGGSTELDRGMMDGLSDPLLHIIRNAVNHGIERPEVRTGCGKSPKGLLILAARRDKDNVVIRISDDGAGIDHEKLRKKAVEKGMMSPEEARTLSREELIDLLFQPGFSTAETITDISGRGVGLDVVKKAVESLKGLIKVETVVGKGTVFELVLPPTMAIVDVMMVHINKKRCAIPISNVVEVAALKREAIHSIGTSEAILLRDEVLPVHRLEEMFGRSGVGETLVVLQNNGKKSCIVVNSVEGQQEVVVKPLSRLVGNCRGVSGITIPGDGDVVPVLDVNTMI